MKKSIKLVSILMVLATMGMTFAGCSKQTSATSAQSKDKIKVGVVVQTLENSVYVIMKKNSEDKAKELGAQVIFQDCKFNAATQKNQVENMLSQGINVLVMEPADAESMAATAQAARDAGKKVINLESRISNFKADLWIVADSYKVGQTQVDSFVKVWGEQKPANVVVISGTVGDEIAESITKGVIDEVKKYPNLKIVYQQNAADWDRQKAMNYMEDAIVKQNKAIDVVFANNDGMALGALKAAENSSIDKNMWFVGADNDKETNEAILAGKNVMTIDKGAAVQGQRITEAANMLAKGEKVQQDAVVDGIPVWYTPIEIVNKDTAKKVSGEKFPELFK